MLRPSASIVIVPLATLSLLAHSAGCAGDDDDDDDDDAPAADAGGAEDAATAAERDAAADGDDAGTGEDRDATTSAGRDAATGDDAGGPPAATIAVDGLCDLLADKAPLAVCTTGENDAACRALIEAHESFLRCSALVTAVAAGRIAFDGEAAAACIEEISDEGLARTFESAYLDCPGAFEGQVGEAEDCYRGYQFANDECGAGLYCPDGSCPSQCRPYQPLGESCPSAGRCDPTLTCSYDCVRPCEGTCVEKPGEGEGCEPTQGVCATGLICDASQMPYTCITPRDTGEACTRQYQCASSSCVDGKCVDRPDDTCGDNADCAASEFCGRTRYGSLECLARLATGAECVDDADQCQAGLLCLFNRDSGMDLCRASAGVDGDPCVPWGCEPDHYCAAENDGDVCRPAHAKGEACDDASLDFQPMNSPCQAGLRCMFSNGTVCLPPGAQGDPCYYADVDSCQPGLVCLGYALSTCQPPSAQDAACNPMFDDACTAGLYCACTMNGDSCDYACAEKLANGQECDDPHICASDYCDYTASPSVCADEPPLRAQLCLPP